MSSNYFFDSHFHLMNLSHPDFISLSGFLNKNTTEIFKSGAFSSNYILTSKNIKNLALINSILNTTFGFEADMSRTLEMIEKDLKGEFLDPKDNKYDNLSAYIKDEKLEFRNKSYDKIGICPLVMDFSRSKIEDKRYYYSSESIDRITPYAEDTINAIDRYHEKNPQGILEFFPFLGLNPPKHDKKFIQYMLETYINTSKSRQGETKTKRFYGVKIYPPLGTNPWPEGNKEEMEKVNIIYDFCQSEKIPIITHCDNQGFKGLPPKVSDLYTCPKTWEKVLKNYPNLYLDFAHVGYQYNIQDDISTQHWYLKPPPLKNEWFLDIIRLIKTYPNVYTDLSFTGTMKGFYIQLMHHLSKDDDCPWLLSKILFGSDFSVNLIKVSSYLEYYNIFDCSFINDEIINQFASRNPQEFLGITK
ncbi:MAG: amidohydrolase [Sphaerochaetaceae bacterium]|nr:amidohydrolase family protein [Sphaerochaetaceae bacterium]